MVSSVLLATVGALVVGSLGWRIYRVRSCRYDHYMAFHKRFAHLANDLDSMTYLEAGEILKLTHYWDFPFTATLALSFALFKTYAVGSISRVLNMSNELASPVTAGRRAEDTALLIIELLGQGLDSEAGSTALSRMNYLHSRYGKLITRDDLLYTLSLFVFEPIDFIADYEWRPLSPLEAHARYVFWREVGARMGISDIPRTMADFRQWKEEYHKIATVYDPENVKTADATVDVLLGPLPKFARPFGQQASIVLLDDRVRTAFGWQRASPSLLYWLIPATLRLRALVVRYLLYPRTEPPAFLQSSPSTDGKTFVRKGFVFQPWYVSAGASRFGAVGYGKPGGARWKSEGFQHVSLGPERLSEVGLDKTLQDAQTLRERAGVCPFFM